MTTDISTLREALNWKLLRGSHAFPGPDGGTCINEVALVAAGFRYREIGSADELPPCFSRPICNFAMFLNDFMPDDARQSLIAYVPRLIGTADHMVIEGTREAIIRAGTIEVTARFNIDLGCACSGCLSLFAAKGSQGLWGAFLAILDRALAIGKQADPIELSVIAARAEQAKRSALQLAS